MSDPRTAEFINGTRDSNRGGEQRMDFVVYRSDGSFCRLHPGSKPKLDAKVYYVKRGWASPIAGEPIPGIPFTYELASSPPSTDRMGKISARQLLAAGVPIGDLPVTGDAPFKWWLFACNLGNNTQHVIGPGIISAGLDEDSTLVFTRSDASTVRVRVSANGTTVLPA